MFRLVCLQVKKRANDHAMAQQRGITNPIGGWLINLQALYDMDMYTVHKQPGKLMINTEQKVRKRKW